jgi:hypothetical protein
VMYSPCPIFGEILILSASTLLSSSTDTATSAPTIPDESALKLWNWAWENIELLITDGDFIVKFQELLELPVIIFLMPVSLLMFSAGKLV